MYIILPEIKCLIIYFFFDLVVVYSASAITPTPKAPVWKCGFTV